MRQNSNNARQAHLDYVVSGEDEREYEDGILISSRESELEYDAFTAVMATQLVREAFVMTAFHYWERSARQWTELRDKRDGFELLKTAVGQKYPVHTRLPDVNTLNNLLKHDSAEKAEKLFAAWPELFRELFESSVNKFAAKRRLSISDKHVEEIFDIVAASGPQYEN